MDQRLVPQSERVTPIAYFLSTDLSLPWSCFNSAIQNGYYILSSLHPDFLSLIFQSKLDPDIVANVSSRLAANG